MEKIKKIFKSDYFICALMCLMSFLLIYITGLMLFERNVFNVMKDDVTLQYVHLFNYVRNSLLNSDFSFYSLSLGLGSNMIPSYAYYCMSPFNLLLILSNEKTISIFLSVIVILKIFTSCMTMKVYLKKKVDNKTYSTLFSIIYGFSAFSLIYISNLMWLDAVIMLPLIVLGLEKLVEKGDCKLYIISLSLAILFNFYTAFPICVFCVLYFILHSLHIKKHRISKFIFSSLFSGVINSWFLIPTIFGLLDSKSAISVVENTGFLNYNPLYMLPRLFVGNISFSNDGGLTNFLNIYSGLLPIILVIITLFNNKVDSKLKKLFLTLIIGILFITNIDVLDKAMHLFAEPDYYPYRYTFIFSFLIISFAYIGINNLNIKKKNIFVSLIMIIVCIILYITNQTNLTTTLLIINILFLIIYGILSSKKNNSFNKIITVVCFLELIISSVFMLNNQIIENEDKYIINSYTSLISSIKEDTSLYRIDYINNPEKYMDNFNDSLSYGTHSTEMFLPTIDSDNYNLLLNILGYLDGGMVPPLITTEGSTEFTSALLGVKYIIEDENSYKFNSSTFPLLFKTDAFSNPYFGNYKLENQNLIYNELFKENLYEKIKCEDNEYCLCLKNNVDCSKGTQKYYYVEMDDPYGSMILSLEDGIHNLNESNYIYILDKSKLNEKARELTNEIEVNLSKSNMINVKLLNDENNQIIFTTIPYDEGWRVLINGEKTNTVKVFDSLLAFEIPKGELDIELKFIPKGINLGLVMSIVTFIVWIGAFVITGKMKTSVN